MTRQNTVAGRSIEEQFEQFQSCADFDASQNVLLLHFHLIYFLQGYVLKKKISR